MNSRAGAGRPARSQGETEEVRTRLLDTARELFSTSEFKSVTIKRIADSAGVNGAMVHYYFGGKKGLYAAMVEQIFEPLETGLQQMESQHVQSVRDFIRLYSRLLAENPWWPNFAIREILFGEDGFRQQILDRMDRKIAPLILGMLKTEIRDGHFRADLDPQLALISLMGMIIFPRLNRPMLDMMLRQRSDIADPDALTERLIEHTSELFLYGAVNPLVNPPANPAANPLETREKE